MQSAIVAGKPACARRQARSGNLYDNAMPQSLFATLECELIDCRAFRSHDEPGIAVFEFIEGFYNPPRATRRRITSRQSNAMGNAMT